LERTNHREAVQELSRKLLLAFALWAIAFASGTSGAEARLAVAISPTYAQLVTGQTLQFSATVSGSSDTRVIWQVNNADGGEPTSGTISISGLYTPPQTLPDPALVTITAVARADRAASATASVTLLGQAASGKTYYVATDGNDTNNGSIDAPWATVQHAADAVAAGDTVLVRGGVYNAYAGFKKSGSAASGFITFAN
jgi:hypothetical protein